MHIVGSIQNKVQASFTPNLNIIPGDITEGHGYVSTHKKIITIGWSSNMHGDVEVSLLVNFSQIEPLYHDSFLSSITSLQKIKKQFPTWRNLIFSVYSYPHTDGPTFHCCSHFTGMTSCVVILEASTHLYS